MHLPTDCRIYNKSSDGLTKNDHFQSMLQKAAERGFTPEHFLFGTWHASLANLKFIQLFQLDEFELDWNAIGASILIKQKIILSRTVDIS